MLCAGCQSSSAPEKPSSNQTKKIPIDPATVATIHGVVSFTGTPPEAKPLDMSQDPACIWGAPKSEPGMSEGYVVAGGHVANVFIYVKSGLEDRAFDAPSISVTLDQKGCRYTPHVLGIMAGQKLHIVNSDMAMHNVHTMSKINPAANISQMPKADPVDQVFAQPEIMFPVQCNQHPWMKMYMNVLPHPFFAVSAADGSFTISGLPPGNYTIAAVHEKMGEKTVQVTIGAKEKKQLDFAFSAQDAANAQR